MIVIAHLRFVSPAVLFIIALSQTSGAFERGQFELGVDGSASRELLEFTDDHTRVRFPTRVRMGIATAGREAIEVATTFDFASQSGSHSSVIDLSFAISFHFRSQVRGQSGWFVQPIGHMTLFTQGNRNSTSSRFQLGFGGAVGYKIFAQNGLGPRFDIFFLRRFERSLGRFTNTIGVRFGISFFPKQGKNKRDI